MVDREDNHNPKWWPFILFFVVIISFTLLKVTAFSNNYIEEVVSSSIYDISTGQGSKIELDTTSSI